MSNVAKLSTSSNWPEGAIPERWIESLFNKMLDYYGAKFADQWRGTDSDTVKRIWAAELGKLTEAQMVAGVEKLKTRDWPPTLPEFIKLCKPSVDPTVAYYEAVNGIQARERGEKGQWSHPAIFWAAIEISAFDLRNQTYSQIKARWEKALSDQMEKGEWAAVPDPLLALPEPGKSKMAREHAEKMVHELQASDTIKKATDKTDHKLWAKRILERAKLQNHGLSALQIRFAKEALAASAS